MIPRPANDQPSFAPEAGIVQHLDAAASHFVDDVGVFCLAGLNRLEHGLGHAALVQPLFNLCGKSLAVDCALMDDGDRFVAKSISQEIAGDPALDVVATADAEYGREALVGQLRAGGER